MIPWKAGGEVIVRAGWRRSRSPRRAWRRDRREKAGRPSRHRCCQSAHSPEGRPRVNTGRRAGQGPPPLDPATDSPTPMPPPSVSTDTAANPGLPRVVSGTTACEYLSTLNLSLEIDAPAETPPFGSPVRDTTRRRLTAEGPLFTIEMRELSAPAPTGKGPGQRQSPGLSICTTGSEGGPTKWPPATPPLGSRTTALTTTSSASPTATPRRDRRRG